MANAGPSDAASVSVTDTLPAGVTFVSATAAAGSCTNVGNVSVTCTRPALAAGATAPTITVVVTAPAQAGDVDQHRDGLGPTPTRMPANNTSTAIDDGDGVGRPVAREDRPGHGQWPAGRVSYTLVVANAGPSDAANLSVLDTLPAGVTFVSATGTGWVCTNVANTSVTCTRPSLATGATAPTITVLVTAPAQAGSLTNSATVSSPTPDPNLGNNTSTAVTTVTASADLSIVKTGPATVTAARRVSYSLVVANAGPSDAASVSVVDTLPAGVTFVSATGTGWACTNVANTR